LSDEKILHSRQILEARLDNSHPLAWGMPERALVYFERSAAFTLEPGSPIERVAWFDRPLRSGWAWGQKYLKDKTAIAVAPIGRGRSCIVGNESPSAAKPTAPSRCCSTPFNWVR
jgi:hypothetical protein